MKLPTCSTISTFPTIEPSYVLGQTLFWTCRYKIIKTFFAQFSYKKKMSTNTLMDVWLPLGRDRPVDGSVGEHYNPGEQKALNLGCSCCAWQWIPGTAGLVLTSSKLSNHSPTWHPLFKATLPSVLGPPDSGLVHTGSLSSVGGFGSVCISDWMDSLCLRGTVGDSGENVGVNAWLCKSVCVDRAGASGCTVWTGKCKATGSSGDVEGTDSAGVVWQTCTGCDECVGSWGCEEGGVGCWVHGSFCLCSPGCVFWACVFAGCSAVE